jgi:hypothetical protein
VLLLTSRLGCCGTALVLLKVCVALDLIKGAAVRAEQGLPLAERILSVGHAVLVEVCNIFWLNYCRTDCRHMLS